MKHWQLFVLLIGIPVLYQIFSVGLIFTIDTSFDDVRHNFPIIMALFAGSFVIWIYALGTGLHKKLPANAVMNLTMFKSLLLFYCAYVTLITLFVTYAMSGVTPQPMIFALIIPCHLFAMFCGIYSIYFNAKALKSVELQRPVVFGDFAGEFFLFWFYPIGIWILQPRINQLFNESPSALPE